MHIFALLLVLHHMSEKPTASLAELQRVTAEEMRGEGESGRVLPKNNTSTFYCLFSIPPVIISFLVAYLYFLAGMNLEMRMGIKGREQGGANLRNKKHLLGITVV